MVTWYNFISHVGRPNKWLAEWHGARGKSGNLHNLQNTKKKLKIKKNGMDIKDISYRSFSKCSCLTSGQPPFMNMSILSNTTTPERAQAENTTGQTLCMLRNPVKQGNQSAMRSYRNLWNCL